MGDYTPEWARDDSPTKGLSDTAAVAYWKAHAVLADAKFATREGHGKPFDLYAEWLALKVVVERAKGETAEHRRLREQLRHATRLWLDGQNYDSRLPAIDAARPVKAAKPVRTCPHCHGPL